MKQLLIDIELFYMEYGDTSKGRSPSLILEDLRQYYDNFFLEISDESHWVTSSDILTLMKLMGFIDRLEFYIKTKEELA